LVRTGEYVLPETALTPEVTAVNKLRFSQMAMREKVYKDLYEGFRKQATKIRKIAIEALSFVTPSS